MTRHQHDATIDNVAAGWVVGDDTDAVTTRNGSVVAASQRRDAMASKQINGAYVSMERGTPIWQASAVRRTWRARTK